jgi:hypothetical protein
LYESPFVIEVSYQPHCTGKDIPVGKYGSVPEYLYWCGRADDEGIDYVTITFPTPPGLSPKLLGTGECGMGLPDVVYQNDGSTVVIFVPFGQELGPKHVEEAFLAFMKLVALALSDDSA